MPLKRNSQNAQRIDTQELLLQSCSTKETVRPTQTSADVSGSGRSRLEKPFTRGASLVFHGAPRRYTLAQKIDTPKSSGCGVFVLRSSPQIIDGDSSDEELEPEDRDDDDQTAYSFPCEDLKIKELVRMMVGLNLGTGLDAARPTVTPTRVRASAFPFVPARTPVSSAVAAFSPAVVHSPSTQYATTMEVDGDVLDRKVTNNDVTYPQTIAEVVPMDGVVFHPEVRDIEMTDVFAFRRKLPCTALIYNFPLIL